MQPADAPQTFTEKWRHALAVYAQWACLRMLALGFAAGLPFLLVFGTFSFWLREAGIDRATIGYLSWIGLMYGFKWVWAPLVDKLPVPLLSPRLGQRRAWLLVAQCGVIAGLLVMASVKPQTDLSLMVFAALFVAFCSATQDIALDAYRIESADAQTQAALAAAYQTGYRGALITAGAGVLWIAASSEAAGYHGWQTAYVAMAALMGLGIAACLLSPRLAEAPINRVANLEKAKALAQKDGLPLWLARLLVWLDDALVAPFKSFVNQFGWQHAALILALIACYRISDIVMGVMANPFYVDMGYTKEQIATLSKTYGVVMTLLGAGLGGLLVMQFGVMRILMLGAVLSALSNLLFAWLHGLGAPSFWGLAGVISIDNLSGGIASAAFVAYLSSLTQRGYSATQYALFTSLMLLLPKFIAGFSGKTVNAYGYSEFFIGTALIGLPVCGLVWLVGRQAPARHKA